MMPGSGYSTAQRVSTKLSALPPLNTTKRSSSPERFTSARNLLLRNAEIVCPAGDAASRTVAGAHHCLLACSHKESIFSGRQVAVQCNFVRSCFHVLGFKVNFF